MIDNSSLLIQDEKFFKEQIMDKQHGFICSDDDLDLVVRLDRLTKCLVRLGNGRFVCSAQDVHHLVKMVEKSEMDHVRDISVMKG
jgi:hypothetical protein